ncbi:9816_t:CDS:10, partial [Cetraspora pellucida]
MVFDFTPVLSSSTNRHCNFLVERKKNLFSFSPTGSSTSEEEIDYSVENPTQKTDFGNKMINFFPSPVPVTASVFERGIIFAISLYASMRLVKIMAANEVGRIESLDLILLAIWTWCVYSFDLPNDVDDGAFYGTLLVPTVAAAKLVDIHRSTSVHDDINIVLDFSFYEYQLEFFEANFELCIVMGCGILIHMFMSKHVNLPNMSVIWAMTIVTLLSIMLVISMASLGLLPLFETVVAQAITLLAVELWVITVKKFKLIKIPSLNHHFPGDITIFQIALVLGMFLIGIILSPLLVYSRNLAQRPAWKNKRKRVFHNGRKWTSFAIFIANMSGILTLGLGDAMASIVGKRYGRRRWPGTSKTVEGTIAFIIFHLLGAFAVTRLWSRNNLLPSIEEWLYYTLAVSITEHISGLRAYHNTLYDIQLSRKIFYDGLRPVIPKNVPKLVAKLIIKCWNIQPDKRPTSKVIYDTINTWYNEILDDKPTEIVAQIKEADKILESKMSTSSDFDTYPETCVSRQFDALSAMDI